MKYCCFCQVGTEISNELKVFKCPNCNKEYCPQCNKYHPGQTCEEFLEYQEKQKNEENFIEIKKRGKNLNKNVPKDDFQKKKPDVKPKNYVKDPKKIKAGQEKKTRENQKKKEDDLSLKFLMENFKKCPKCKQLVEKISGCNFMKCSWPGCVNTYFCLICEKSLTVIFI